MSHKVRKSSGCVVYRQVGDGLEFLLVTATGKFDTWVFPKGGVEPGMTSMASAKKEVYEEAGVEGRIMTYLGMYRYMKKDVLQEVEMFAMKYLAVTLDWPEQDKRERMWCDQEHAMALLDSFLAPYLLMTVDYLEQR